jgi:O-antigen/teichoic acid export membrane protein
MQNIKQKTKIGMFWNAFEKVAVQGISFVLSIILARLLTPHDYGTIGMMIIFLAFSNVFVDSGFTRALIQKQDRTEEDFSTTLIFNIAVSCLLYAILFFAAPAIANFYETPELVVLQRVFFLVIILNSLTVVQNAKLQIKVDFKSIAIIHAVSTVISGGIAIYLAYKGAGAWALVGQSIIKSAVSALCFWITNKWIPKTRFSKTSFKRLFGFGSKLLACGLLSTTVTNIYNLIIGKIYNPASLGHYTRAQQFPELTVGTLGSVLNNATFPLMATLQNKSEELISTFGKLIKLSALVSFPAMVGLAILSEDIIMVLLGEKWMPAAELLFWLSLSYIFTPFSILNLNLLNAIGRSDLFMKIDFSKVPIIIVAMVITFPISLKAVVIGKVVTAFIFFYMNTFMVKRIYGFGAFKQLACVWKCIVATVIMAIAVWGCVYFINNSFLSLIIGISIGIVIYMGTLAVLKEEECTSFFTKVLKIND